MLDAVGAACGPDGELEELHPIVATRAQRRVVRMAPEWHSRDRVVARDTTSRIATPSGLEPTGLRTLARVRTEHGPCDDMG